MQIDSYTVLFFGLAVKGLLGVLFLYFWIRDRQTPFGWWSATLLLGAVTTAFFMLRCFAPNLLAVGLGNIILITAVNCCWQGARAFHRRPPFWPALIGAPALWLAFCLVPGFMDNVAARVVVSSLIIAPLLALSGVEFWRGRDEMLPARWPIIGLFASLAAFFAARIVFVNVAPFPFGALPMEQGWVGGFNLIIFFHTMLLTVLIVALSKEQLEFEQRTKAQTDPLTGALNRRAFMGRGSRLLLRHQIEQAPLCLLFLDIDHFKSLNDRFGHSGGDDVLTAFVKMVHDNIRPTDFLFRIGGEEFCCLLPYTDMSQAHQVAERIRHKFEVMALETAGKLVRATVSIGIASSELFGYEIDTLMRRADNAVYTAKRQGRNRVVVATTEEAPDRGLRVVQSA